MQDSHASDLQRLCRHCGVIGSYRSVTGEQVGLEREERIALLQAMGLPAATASDARDSLRSLESRTWSRLLDPVLVLPVGFEAFVFTARLSEEHLQRRHAWTLIEESGRIRHGFAQFNASGYGRLDGVAMALCRAKVEARLPPGYHRLELREEFAPGQASAISLIVVPHTAHERGDSMTALSIQNYALHSIEESFTGIGTLREIGALARRFPGLSPGLSPLHALFYSRPNHRSPYSPSNRLFLNPMLLDPFALPEAESPEVRRILEAPDFQRERGAVVAGDTIPYESVAALRGRLLEALFQSFYETQHGRGTPRDRDFARFRRAGGEALHDHALFEALEERSPELRPGCAHPRTAEARTFAREHERRLLFHQYLQWTTRRQLRVLEREARTRNTGLYLDLAVGAAPDGSEVWSNPGAYAAASIGAPPDAFSPAGQDWGLAPFHPLGLRDQAYRPFIRLLRNNMPRGGALRIDHVMGLARLYWNTESGGGYVRYPFAELAGILMLESRRKRCIVVGEDLGTVPEDMRQDLRQRKIFSFRVVYFEKSKDDFLPPASYPAGAAAALTTHDLPTLRGFVEGRDIDQRQRLGSLDPEAARAARATRTREVAALLRLTGMESSENSTLGTIDTAALTGRLHLMLRESPARLKQFSLHDILNEADQPNLPGTVDEYPNWALRYSRPIEEIASDSGRIIQPE